MYHSLRPLAKGPFFRERIQECRDGCGARSGQQNAVRLLNPTRGVEPQVAWPPYHDRSRFQCDYTRAEADSTGWGDQDLSPGIERDNGADGLGTEEHALDHGAVVPDAETVEFNAAAPSEKTKAGGLSRPAAQNQNQQRSQTTV